MPNSQVRLAHVVLIFAFVAVLAVSPAAQGSAPTFQSRIDAAQSGDTLEVPAGPIEENLVIPARLQRLILVGTPAGGASRSVLRFPGADTGPVLRIEAGAEVELRDVEFVGRDQTPTPNSQLIQNYGTLTATNCLFRGHASMNAGAGLANLGPGDARLRNCQFTSNQAYAGPGGAIYNEGRLTLEDSVLANNRSSEGGGGLMNAAQGEVSLTRTRVNENHTGGFSFATAKSGGGICNLGTCTLEQSHIYNNRATQEGAGIYNAGRVRVVSSTLSDNWVYAGWGHGGGIANDGAAVLVQSTLSKNRAASLGGGLYSGRNATLNLLNCTVTANTVGVRSFGPEAPEQAEDSSLGGQGSGVFADGSLARARSTIIAANTCYTSFLVDDCGGDVEGVLSSEGNNLIGSIHWGVISLQPQATDLLGTISQRLDPGIADLASMDDLPPIHRLNSDSPAIDHGSCTGLDKDQVGAPRTVDEPTTPNPFDGRGCDIGSSEYQAPPPLPSRTAPSPIPNLRLSKAGQVDAILALPDGGYVVGGRFTEVNGESRRGLARFSRDHTLDQTWHFGVNGEVLTLALTADQEHLLVGGTFQDVSMGDEASGSLTHSPLANLAKLRLSDGSAWDPLWRPNPNDTVRVLAVDSTNLYVGGDFSSVGGQDQANLAKLVTTGAGTNDMTREWRVTLDGSVRALELVSESLLIGGSFTTVEGQPRHHLARLILDSSCTNSPCLDASWQLDASTPQTMNLPSGSDDGESPITVPRGHVSALLQVGDFLYVGGDFSIAKELPRAGLFRARWQPGEPPEVEDWQAPIQGQVNALAMDFARGLLLVGGQFASKEFGGVTNLAGFGTNALPNPPWTNSVDGPVLALAVVEPDLLVGGRFSLAQSDLHPAIAKLDPVSGSFDPAYRNALTRAGEVRTLATQADGKLLVGGDFLFANSIPRPYLARVNADGSLDSGWAPAPNGVVEHLATTGSQVYAAGRFTRIGGQVRKGLVRLSATDGDGADPLWDPQLDGVVTAMSLTPDHLIVAGGFVSTKGMWSDGLARIQLFGAGEPELDWRPSTPPRLFQSTELLDPERLWTLLLVPESIHYRERIPTSLLHFLGARIGREALLRIRHSDDEPSQQLFSLTELLNAAMQRTSMWSAEFQGSSVRPEARHLAELDPEGQALIRLNRWLLEDVFGAAVARAEMPTFDGAGVRAMAVQGDSLYLGGELSVGGQANLVKVSLRGTGVSTNGWLQDFPNGAVSTLAVQSNQLYVGGSFTRFGSETRNGLARILLPTPSTPQVQLDPDWQPQLTFDGTPGEVRQLSATPQAVYVSGRFTRLTTPSPSSGGDLFHLAKLNPNAGGTAYDWTAYTDGPIQAMLGQGHDLWVGGEFSRVSGSERAGVALIPTVEGLRVVVTDTNTVRLLRDFNDGPDVTGFQIESLTGGELWVGTNRQVQAGDRLTAEEGAAGLSVVPRSNGGSVSFKAIPIGVGDSSVAVGVTANLPPTNTVPAFALDQTDYQVREGQRSPEIRVVKVGSGSGRVRLRTVPGTAEPGAKYLEREVELVFDTRDVDRLVEIPIADDVRRQGSQSFFVQLEATELGQVADPARARITIVDDEIVGSSVPVLVQQTPRPSPATHALSVSLGERDAPAGAGWRLVGMRDEDGWRDFGSKVDHLEAGVYQIEFRKVLGFLEPKVLSVQIPTLQAPTFILPAGFGYQAQDEAKKQMGQLTLRFSPANGSGWTVASDQTDPPAWIDSGVARSLPVYTDTGEDVEVRFRDIPGWVTPPPRSFRVGPEQETAYSVAYRRAEEDFEASQGRGPHLPEMLNPPDSDLDSARMNVGQIITELGAGSGVLVKPQVVLTAGHVLFDDGERRSLVDPESVKWLYQRDAGLRQPAAIIPRGVILLSGYPEQRIAEGRPGESSAGSRQLDAATLYFFEEAGRGGASGFLVSDSAANEWLMGRRKYALSGYPRIRESTKIGRLFVTQPSDEPFRHPSTEERNVFVTEGFSSLPGNSGGPVFVQPDGATYFPAGIYLGGSGGESYVRAIDSTVVDLINRAEKAGNRQGNYNDAARLSVDSSSDSRLGKIEFRIEPPEAIRAGARWFYSTNTAERFENTTHRDIPGTLVTVVPLSPVPGFTAPSSTQVQFPAAGGETRVILRYVPLQRLFPQLSILRPERADAGLNLTYRQVSQFPLHAESSPASEVHFEIQSTSSTSLARIDGTNLVLNTTPGEVGTGSFTVLVWARPDPADTYDRTQRVFSVVISPREAGFPSIPTAPVNFDGRPHPRVAITDPPGLATATTYEGPGYPRTTQAPSQPGTYSVITRVTDPNYFGATTNAWVIAKAGNSINFGPLPTLARVGDILFPNATSSAGLPVTLSVTEGSPATLVEGALQITAVGEVVLHARSAEASNAFEVAEAELRFRTFPGIATLAWIQKSLGGTYNREAHRVEASTDPTNLPILFTYDGSTTAPVNAGTYAVTGSVVEPNYTAVITGALVIAKAPQAIAVPITGSLPFNTTSLSLPVVTDHNLPVTAEVLSGPGLLEGALLKGTGAGTVRVRLRQAGDANHEEATREFALELGRAEQTLQFGTLLPVMYQPPSSVLQLRATASSGLPVGFAILSGEGDLTGDQLRVSQAGRIRLQAFQPGNENFLPAPAVEQELEVQKARAELRFVSASLRQNYDGRSHEPQLDTVPPGLPLTLSFDGSPSLPTNIGAYLVEATVEDPNYFGFAAQIFRIEASTNSPPRLEVRRGNDTLQIAWPRGVLESAEGLSGPWRPVPNAQSPATIPLVGGRHFYRVRVD